MRSFDALVADRKAAWWWVTRALLGEVTPGLSTVTLQVLDDRVEVRIVHDPTVGADPRRRADAEETSERVRAAVDAAVAVETVLHLVFVDARVERDRARAGPGEEGPRSRFRVYERGPELGRRDV